MRGLCAVVVYPSPTLGGVDLRQCFPNATSKLRVRTHVRGAVQELKPSPSTLVFPRGTTLTVYLYSYLTEYTCLVHCTHHDSYNSEFYPCRNSYWPSNQS